MKSKLLLLVSFACCAAAAVYFMEGVRSGAQTTAQIVDLATPVLQFTPAAGNTNYFLLETNGNTIVSGIMNLQAHVGNSTEIKWFGRRNVGYIISHSTNMVDWEQIRVIIVGSDRDQIWYDYLDTNKVYRIGSFIAPPGNFVGE